ncbi:ABC transporter substrate-binding protein [Mycoplasma sp. ES3225-GEN-MYC]|uniref:ABC transporter substrate-binding protein n=1 Tax=Mycoplasma miroungigenitalium TaxID=754515 RepID=A0A6M4JAW1_9MOLU|nr:ABC transporter substrate-binding protein [Mycoplasma miroungigenitalium]MBU4691556.1 ABC transporter substrate-binding protein [Mycoplasma miroungigenitalium]QJR43388.1 ABC transporter substrate-binding protein [Mycoplasma miroungigenitalium]
MKFIKKIISASAPLTLTTATLMSASCNNKTNEKTKENLDLLWDTEITITNSWINPGFQETKKETDFLNLLSKRFNELKNKDESTKHLPDVKFNIETKDKGTYIQDIENDNKKNDLLIANYTVFSENFWQDGKFVNDNNAKLVAQTSTLKFNWQSSDNDFYKDGTSTDPLRIAAVKNNEIWVKNTGFEYPDWPEAIKQNKINFDGSKYDTFYSKDKLTYVYHGAILISGNFAKRTEITKDWEDKNWEKFVTHGIVYSKNTSAGGFKYQAALLARHFNKPLNEILEYLNSNSEYVFKGTKPKSQLGKESQNSKGVKIVPHIAFDDEGSYNWTENNGENNYYKPQGFKSNKKFEDQENDVIRTLTLTNPAAYDVVLGRKGLHDKQVELIAKALTSLTLQENTYGIYTGYNKFQPLSNELFEKYVKLQVQAETVQDLVNDIPEIN